MPRHLHLVGSEDNSHQPGEDHAAGFIMIVDDRATARSLLLGLARSIERGIRVECFSEPKAALGRATERTPDLIITDYNMPGMNGVEFVKRIRTAPNLADTPIVMVTVVEDRGVRYQALEAGATDFLTRPIDPLECLTRCRNLLALRRSQKALADRINQLEEQVLQVSSPTEN